jgi:predicted KAP-like P-loop ATPase
MQSVLIDDATINELVAISHSKNAQEAIVYVINEYLKQHRNKEKPLFDQLRLDSNFSNEEVDLLFKRDKADTARDIDL